MAARVALITGASTGIGRSIASTLSQNGWAVLGTSRNPPKAEPIPGVEFLPLDVRSDNSCRTCVDAILSRSGRIDALVNNAGESLHGAIEESSMEEAKALFETNFFGVVRMTRAALPTMRRQGGGRIVNISSISGVIAAPFIGFYSASKWAIEGYSESLRHEVWPFGVRVVIVEPGWIRTDIARHAARTEARLPEYDRYRRRAGGATEERVSRGSDPSVVAACVLRVLEHSSPRLRYRVGASSGAARLRRILPASMFERGVRRYFGLSGDRTEPPPGP